MRKGQAALEFLTTYGWAFIVILIMIGALAYFGVLNPNKVLPRKCTLEAGFDCKDYVISSTGTFDIILVNKKGESLKNVTIASATSDASAINLVNCQPTNGMVPTDSEFNLNCTGLSLAAVKGDKIKIEFTFNYTMAKGTYSQVATGEMYAAVQ